MVWHGRSRELRGGANSTANGRIHARNILSWAQGKWLLDVVSGGSRFVGEDISSHDDSVLQAFTQASFVEGFFHTISTPRKLAATPPRRRNMVGRTFSSA